jgi:phosphoribosyl 1,2-cyclic phosphodiesterase
MLSFTTLGSGSRGNALLVETGDTLLMVDCGLPRRDVEARLKSVGRSPVDVTAVLITHEHADHIRSAASFCRRYGTDVWMTPGTAASVRGLPRINTFSGHRELRIGGFEVEPYPVPHDAREPVQFVFRAGDKRLGLLTDAGHVTPHMVERLAGCDALALEFNHDPDQLAGGTYPESVKHRVASRYGHLSNDQAAALLARFRGAGLQWVIAMHVSEQNNSAEHVRAAIEPVADDADWAVHVAAQDAVSGWIDVE